MRISNSNYSIDERGFILNDRGFPVKPYQIEGISGVDFVDLKIHQNTIRFSVIEVLRRTLSVAGYKQLKRDLKAKKRAEREEYEMARAMHREAVRAQPEWSEFPV